MGTLGLLTGAAAVADEPLGRRMALAALNKYRKWVSNRTARAMAEKKKKEENSYKAEGKTDVKPVKDRRKREKNILQQMDDQGL